jgi:hypothetical protein
MDLKKTNVVNLSEERRIQLVGTTMIHKEDPQANHELSNQKFADRHQLFYWDVNNGDLTPHHSKPPFVSIVKSIID